MRRWFRKLFGRKSSPLQALYGEGQPLSLKDQLYPSWSGEGHDRNLFVGTDVVITEAGHFAGQFQPLDDRQAVPNQPAIETPIDRDGPGNLEIRRRVDGTLEWDLVERYDACLSREEAWRQFDLFIARVRKGDAATKTG